MIESSSPYCFIKQINYPQKNNKYETLLRK